MRIVFDACNNILAAEYLFRKNDKEEYNRRITQLSEIQLNDELMYELHFRMSFNHDYMNLAFMLNQGYFDEQLKILTNFLDASEGMDTLKNHGVMTIEEYLEKKKKGVIQSEGDAEDMSTDVNKVEDAEDMPEKEGRLYEDDNN